VSVRIETTADGRIAVIRGVDTDNALRWLGQSLLVGSAFAGRRGLVIDLGGCQPSLATAEVLGNAGSARLRQHQVVTTAATASGVADAVDRTRRWLDRFDHPNRQNVTAGVVREMSWLRSLVDAGVAIVSASVSGLARRYPKP
jgi:hypothetical protein